MTKYVHKNGRLYWYIRKVPVHIAEIDGRGLIKLSLKTSVYAEAVTKAQFLSKELEEIWDDTVRTDHPVGDKRYKRLFNLAKLYGFEYKPAENVADAPLTEIVERVKVAKKEKRLVAQAVLGAVEQQFPTPHQCLESYWTLTLDEQRGKSKDELRKWKNPRIKAINNFSLAVGDIPIDQISRKDLIAFRQWWLGRIQEDDLAAESANKDFTHLKSVLARVAEAYYHDMPIRGMFEALKVKGEAGKRHPFTTEFIEGTLLNRARMAGLGEELFLFLHAMTNTGARVKELTGLMKEDIVLDHDIPHIIIRKNEIRSLKTKNSERVIPLVGASLAAFLRLPEGFIQYRGKSDNLSNALNKFMRENDVFPSSEHSLYSLRHSFQDRLILAEAPERIQADLMGHAISRPRYGDGAGLAQKAEWMQKISISGSV